MTPILFVIFLLPAHLVYIPEKLKYFVKRFNGQWHKDSKASDNREFFGYVVSVVFRFHGVLLLFLSTSTVKKKNYFAYMTKTTTTDSIKNISK